MRTFNVQNAENIKVMTETMKEILHNKKDIDKVCRPGIFKGVEGKYHEWNTKLMAHLRSHYQHCDKWIAWALNLPNEKEDDATEGNINLKWGDESTKVMEFSSRVYSLLVSITEEGAFKLCQSVTPGEGLEALRILKKQIVPK